jgi:GNAT superfamily N-acetyltransferase
MIHNALGPDGSYRARLLTPADLGELQSLFERGTDYFEVATGAPPAKDEAVRAFVAGPPAKRVDEKRTIGVFDARGELVGVLDAITDWPDSGVWTVGMLLLDPEHRGRGLGIDTLTAFESWAASQGARELQTAIVSTHVPGRRFLVARGYVNQSTIDDVDAGFQRASIVFYSKSV